MLLLGNPSGWLNDTGIYLGEIVTCMSIVIELTRNSLPLNGLAIHMPMDSDGPALGLT